MAGRANRQRPTTVGEYTYWRQSWSHDATFQLRFEPSGRVSGTYTMPQNPNLVLRFRAT